MEKISFKALAQFVTVAEHRSFTRAARALNIAQPWLSLRIRELEEFIGTELFIRGPRGVRPTEGGERLLEQARRVLRESERFVALGREIVRDAVRPLRLGASYDTYGLPRRKLLLDRFSAIRPEVPLEIPNGNDAAMRELLQDDQVDVAFVIGPPPPGMASILFESGTLELLVPEEHPLAARAEVHVADLAGQTVLAWRREVAPPLWDSAIAPLLEYGINVAGSPECSRRAQIDRAAHLRQLTVLPTNFRTPEDHAPGYVARAIIGMELATDVHFVRAPGAADDGRVDALWRLCQDVVRQDPAIPRAAVT